MARPRLAEYEKKRDRKKTPEPFGGKNAGRPIFVVQRHDARRLHYDFRLERDGALASWAGCRRGSLLSAGQRALAVHVEDYLLEYATFEGVILKGSTAPARSRSGTTARTSSEKCARGDRPITGKRLDEPGRLSRPSSTAIPELAHPPEARGRRRAATRAPATTGRPSRPSRLTYHAAASGSTRSSADGYRAIADVRGAETTLTSRNDNDLTGGSSPSRGRSSKAVKTPDCVPSTARCAPSTSTVARPSPRCSRARTGRATSTLSSTSWRSTVSPSRTSC